MKLGSDSYSRRTHRHYSPFVAGLIVRDNHITISRASNCDHMSPSGQ
jgi:hypothetical protein